MVWKPKRIRSKLLLAFAGVGLVLVIAIGTLAYFTARNALRDEAAAGMEALRQTRAEQIHLWFADRQRETRTLAQNPTTITAARSFKIGIDTSANLGVTQSERLEAIASVYRHQPELNNAGDNSVYSANHERFHPFFKETLNTYDYQDILLASSTGDVIYSVGKRADFATNLNSAIYATTAIASAYLQANTATSSNFVIFTDFILYEPSGQPVIFFSTPIFNNTERLGVLILEISTDTLDNILSLEGSLGKTGETYVVGQDGLLRSNSRFSATPTILLQKIDTQASRSALAGHSRTQAIIGYRKVEVLSTWQRLTLAPISEVNPEGIIWALIAEKELSEVEAPANGLLLSMIGASAIAFLGVFILAYMVSQQIANPLRALTQTAQAITSGHLDQQAQITTDDEVGVLAKAFNQMTAQLRQSIAELESRVADLKRAEAQQVELIKELQEANRHALELSRLKSEFLSTMSHELRTPLNAIEGYTGIMLAGMGIELDAKAHHMVERVAANSQRLLGLITDVLDLSRIEAGRVDLVSAPINLRPLVENWQSSMEFLAAEKNLEFKVSIDTTLSDIIYGDEDALTKIVTNLLSNAFKFTPKGQVELNVKNTQSQLVIEVKDTGIGIPPHAFDYIFEEFRQVDGSSKRLYGGSGLGLAIVRKLTQAMNGVIHVDSSVGRGSTFTVVLPLKI